MIFSRQNARYLSCNLMHIKHLRPERPYKLTLI